LILNNYYKKFLQAGWLSNEGYSALFFFHAANGSHADGDANGGRKTRAAMRNHADGAASRFSLVLRPLEKTYKIAVIIIIKNI
jgi:hypothetical protein